MILGGRALGRYDADAPTGCGRQRRKRFRGRWVAPGRPRRDGGAGCRQIRGMLVRLMRKIVMWVVLAMVGLLVILSIAGAFLEIEKARARFNSVPLIVYWSVFVALLLLGFAAFKRLLRSPGLLAAHLGSVLILAGALYGSGGGHVVAAKLLDIQRTPNGFMWVYEGQESNTVRDEAGTEIGRLPLSIRL